MARVRVHQHVNPLAKYYLELPAKPLSLDTLFANPALPLHLDIGSGRGRFILKTAKAQKDWNFLGMEIREPLVTDANEIRNDLNLTNLHYEFCNATISLDILLEKIPRHVLQMITIQFPDPWFKKKHAKRRMVTDKLVNTISENLALNGQVLVQTDVEFLANEMFELFEQNKGFERIEIEKNILPVKTEREKSVEDRNLPIYRTLFKIKK